MLMVFNKHKPDKINKWMKNLLKILINSFQFYLAINIWSNEKKKSLLENKKAIIFCSYQGRKRWREQLVHQSRQLLTRCPAPRRRVAVQMQTIWSFQGPCDVALFESYRVRCICVRWWLRCRWQFWWKGKNQRNY